MDIQNSQIRPVISQGMQQYKWTMLAAILICCLVVFGFLFLAVLVFGGLAYLFYSLAMGYAILIGIVGYAALLLFAFAISYGQYIFPLKLLRGENPDYGTLFIGFTNIKRVICMTLWLFLWYLLWSILLCTPFFITMGIYEVMEQDIILPAAVISYIFLLVGVCILALRYAQVYCILYDNPEMPVRQVLRRSIEMMKGNKKQLFFLIVSVVWWRILVIIGLSCGYMLARYADSIGLTVLFLIVYMIAVFWVALYSSFISPAFYQALITKVNPPEEAEQTMISQTEQILEEPVSSAAEINPEETES